MIKKIIMLVLFIIPVSVSAHTPSSSYLFVSEAEELLQLRWDIALRDLEYVIGLDSNQDQQINWQELKDKQREITAYAYSNLQLKRDNKPCRLGATDLQVVKHTDGAYAVLQILPECDARQGSLTINYSLLFEVDANHRGVILDQRRGGTNSYVAGPESSSIKLRASRSWFANFTTFVQQGIWHILIGFDHILFVITLLLPAVLMYTDKHWVAVDKYRPAMIDLLKVVTSFTLAHSITLSLATLEIVSLPSRWVESAIALSVILVAINNIKPMFIHARWSMAFVFGLIHGFGFANVLSDLNLNNESLIASLLGFNVGVEIGQGFILLLFFPLVYSIRKTRMYRIALFTGGSLVISLIASFWLIQRVIL